MLTHDLLPLGAFTSGTSSSFASCFRTPDGIRRYGVAFAVAFLALFTALTAAPVDAQPPVESSPAFAVTVQEEPPPPEYDPGDPVARGILGPLAGLGMFVAPTAIGLAVGLATMSNCSGFSSSCLSLLAPTAGATIGAIIGLSLYPLGVALGADAVGGRGGTGWAYLGGLIGTAVGLGIFGAGMAIASSMEGQDQNFVIIPAIILGAGAALVGPVIAYEMSDHSARRSSTPELTWMPTFSVDRYGATAGIAGFF